MKRILCWLGIHYWGPMYARIINAGYYDEERWAERRCLCCDRVKEIETEY